MQPQRGVVLYQPFADEPGAGPRLMLSAGMRRGADRGGVRRCCDFAILPGEPWLPLTSEQIGEHVAAAPPRDQGTWISLVKVPAGVLELFRPLVEASAAHQPVEEIERLIYGNRQCQLGIKAARDFAARFNELGECLEEGTGIRANPAGLATVTWDRDRACAIGLHLDSWYAAPLAERHASPNRICFNLGAEDRYLVFVNLTLKQLANSISAAHSPSTPDPRHEDELLIHFLQRFPDYPVMRLRVRPGEAYIAPTENIFHDGSTIGRTTPDIQMTVLGHFQPHVGA